MPEEDFVKNELNYEALEEAVEEGVTSYARLSNFCFRLSEIIEAAAPHEMIEKVVRAALEVEFGTDFTSQAGSAKMIKKLAGSIIDNKNLKTRALSIADICLKSKASEKAEEN